MAKQTFDCWTAYRLIGEDEVAKMWGPEHADQEEVLSINVPGFDAIDMKGERFRPTPIRRAK